jgi:hypothetical protein
MIYQIPWKSTNLKYLLEKYSTKRPAMIGSGVDVRCFDIGGGKVLKVLGVYSGYEREILRTILRYYNNPNSAIAKILEVKQIAPQLWVYIQKKMPMNKNKDQKCVFEHRHRQQISKALRKDPLFLHLEDFHFNNYALHNKKATLIDLGCVVLRKK